VSTALSLPLPAEATVEHHAALHLVETVAGGTSEQTRWMLWFGLPCLSASLFVAAAIGSGVAWLLALAIASLGAAILSLTWLAISSDTNS
jgi:hypothetical protein